MKDSKLSTEDLRMDSNSYQNSKLITHNLKLYTGGFSMLIKSCFNCKYHEAKQDGKEEASYCRRENCWSRYSKCVLAKALEKFLAEESSRSVHPLSTI
jgi:hypothetical protein